MKTSPSTEVTEDPLPETPSKRKLEETDSIPDLSNKRAKNASQTFAKHSRFWALDGNVILQFGAVGFKVHRSRLSTQSVWFEKLFELRAGREEPLEPHEQDIKDVVVEDLDGCDVYHMDPIGSMSDFEALLTAMEDAIEFSYSRPSFLTAAAIIRAAERFDFPKFFKFAERCLQDKFPSDLARFHSKPIPHASDAVVLGRWNVPGILKRAFYELARAQPEDLPARDPDDTRDVDSPLQELDIEDIILLTNAQKRMTAAWLTVLPTAIVCPNRAPCPAGRGTVGWSAFGEDQLLQKYQYDPIGGLNALIAVKWRTAHSFCSSCANAQKELLVAKKEKIWKDMDEWFDI
ncbi:hypothetical protein DFH09DRAFT_914193 [Mycena vulgaris]|nr:hypothetical protein DFH09DRAFT_914193 [Mycena vulgaris]